MLQLSLKLIHRLWHAFLTYFDLDFGTLQHRTNTKYKLHGFKDV